MDNVIVEQEAWIRLGVFLGIFIILAVLELILPRRRLHYSKPRRWSANLGISVVNSLMLRLVFPAAGVGAAYLAQQQGWGLFNGWRVSGWVSIPIFLVIFDVTIYWQHRVFHRVPVLWRIHRMHHTDTDYDLTTGNRFHPLEILLSGLIKFILIVALGPPVAAVILAEIVLNATSLFNHGNLRLPQGLDAVLRKIIVTPDMHRVHHSVWPREYNRNFGFNLSVWDRVFRSYRDQPDAGHENMEIGIRGFQDEKAANLVSMLLQPLRSGDGQA